MNVLDYSIRLGKLLRKTEEGRILLQLEASIEEKYKDNDAFRQYEQFAERKTSQYYFYSWDMAYQTFINVLTDDSIEHRDFFIPTAELISVDKGIKTLASTAVAFGNTFEKIVAVIISGGEYETIIPGSWKYKVKNAISDIQIADHSDEDQQLLKICGLSYIEEIIRTVKNFSAEMGKTQDMVCKQIKLEDLVSVAKKEQKTKKQQLKRRKGSKKKLLQQQRKNKKKKTQIHW